MTKTKKTFIHGSILAIGIIAIYTGLGVLKNCIEIYSKLPKYSFCTESSSVTFRDDIAPGMRATVEYEGKTVEMPLEYVSAESCKFSIPKEALDANEFTVQAVDRDGNWSKQKKLYTLDGIVLEKNPNQ